MTSVQEALQLERATKDEMYAQISAVQSQLQQEQEARLADNSERVQLRQRLVDIEQELEQAKDIGTRAEGLCGEREAELGRVQALLQALESDNKEQVSSLVVNRLASVNQSVSAALILQVYIHNVQFYMEFCFLKMYVHAFCTLSTYMCVCICVIFIILTPCMHFHRGNTTATY